MSKKIFLSLLFVLAFAVSCKNNTTNSTATGTTITAEMFNKEIGKSMYIYVYPDTGKIYDKFDETLSIWFIEQGTEINFADIREVDQYMVVTKSSLINNLHNTYNTADAKIKYEAVLLDEITEADNDQNKISIKNLQITLTPKSENDVFAADIITEDEKVHVTEITDKKIVYKLPLKGRWHTDF